MESAGAALVSTTRLAGQHAVRLCILNPTTSAAHVRQVIEHFAAAPPVAVPAGHALAMPLLSGLPAATRDAVLARAVPVDTAAGEEVIRRRDSDGISAPSAPAITSAS